MPVRMSNGGNYSVESVFCSIPLWVVLISDKMTGMDSFMVLSTAKTKEGKEYQSFGGGIVYDSRLLYYIPF